MSEFTARSIRRVVIAFDHRRQDRQALLQAVEMADRMQAELIALFVEDEQLFQLAQLPFSQEISRNCGLLRKLEVGDITRALTRQVSELQDLLSQSAGKRGLHASVKVVRGRFSVEALAAAGDTDVVIVSVMSQLDGSLGDFGWSQRQASLPVAQRLKPVWVLYDGSPTSVRALELAAESSKSSGASLTVAICTDHDEHGQALRDKAVNALRTRSTPVQICQYSSRNGRELLARLQDSGCSLLLMSHQDPILTQNAEVSIFESVRCPVVLVR